jgi:hypothetical protein
MNKENILLDIVFELLKWDYKHLSKISKIEIISFNLNYVLVSHTILKNLIDKECYYL